MNQRDRLAAVDVISDALHRQTLCDGAPGCAVIHDVEAEQIAAALRRAGWRFLDAETIREAVVRSTLRLPEGIEDELAFMFEVER